MTEKFREPKIPYLLYAKVASVNKVKVSVRIGSPNLAQNVVTVYEAPDLNIVSYREKVVQNGSKTAKNNGKKLTIVDDSSIFFVFSWVFISRGKIS